MTKRKRPAAVSWSVWEVWPRSRMVIDGLADAGAAFGLSVALVYALPGGQFEVRDLGGVPLLLTREANSPSRWGVA
jgi:hypothetical protein